MDFELGLPRLEEVAIVVQEVNENGIRENFRLAIGEYFGWAESLSSRLANARITWDYEL